MTFSRHLPDPTGQEGEKEERRERLEACGPGGGGRMVCNGPGCSGSGGGAAVTLERPGQAGGLHSRRPWRIETTTMQIPMFSCSKALCPALFPERKR